MDYLKQAIELSKASFDAGQFPAGAVLVTKSGKVYESKPSLPHNHGETMVVDMAVESEGLSLTGAVMYASMQPCMMCMAKMYWAGIDTVHYIIPKTAVRVDYAYESDMNAEEIAESLFRPIILTAHPELIDEAFHFYQDWVKKIESL
jgi:tRNA(Arg) A34 adenosine deaminase TadA